jgi:hypothetical protein
MTFGKKAVKKDDTLPYWDLNNGFLERTGGGTLSDGVEYTHAYVLKWRPTDVGWRTLLRHNNDHCIIVKSGAKDLGMYSNRNGAFRDSGYDVRAHAALLECMSAVDCKQCVDRVLVAVVMVVCFGVHCRAAGLTRIASHPQIVPQDKYWEVVLVTGKASVSQPSPTSHTGVSTLYTLDPKTGKMVKRGTVDRVCTGTTYYRIGWPGQGPGKVARALSWNRVLTTNEIQNIGSTLSTCRKPLRKYLWMHVLTCWMYVYLWIHVATLVDACLLVQLTHVRTATAVVPQPASARQRTVA